MQDGLASDIIFFFLNPPAGKPMGWFSPFVLDVIKGSLVAIIAGLVTARTGLRIWFIKKEKERKDEIAREDRAHSKRRLEMRNAIVSELVHISTFVEDLATRKSLDKLHAAAIRFAKQHSDLHASDWAKSDPALFYTLPESVMVGIAWNMIRLSLEDLCTTTNGEAAQMIAKSLAGFLSSAFWEILKLEGFDAAGVEPMVLKQMNKSASRAEVMEIVRSIIEKAPNPSA